MGKVLGIVGLGNVGAKVANAAIGLGMKVIGHDPTISVSKAWELSSSVQQAHSMEDLLMDSDFISLHIPLVNETKHMINHSRFKLMKPGVVLLNFARSEIVDTDALYDALNEKRISMYVNDFPTPKLKDHPRIISLPHIGASTVEAEENCAVIIAKQLRNLLESGAINNSVNFPIVDVPPLQTGVRIAITHNNVPNMVAQMSAKLAAAELNILSLINKSRDGVAYTLIDLPSDVSEAVLADIGKINGVLQVRKLLPISNERK